MHSDGTHWFDWYVIIAVAGYISGYFSYKFKLWGFVPGVFIVWIGMIARIDIRFKEGESPEANALYFLLGWIPGLVWCGIFLALRLFREGQKMQKAHDSVR